MTATPSAYAARGAESRPRGRAHADVFLRALLACVCSLSLCLLLVAPPLSSAAILGDDYVGATTVTDRGLNITEAPAIDASYGILCDAEGNVLWSRGASKHTAMASITKVMTAIVAIENASLDDVYTVSANAVAVGESSANLKQGEEVDLRTLLNGLLVHSGNDAAVVIAEGVAGSEKKFVKMMNEKADEMGLEDTHFSNSNGLDAAKHYSSASDVCVMTRYAMTYEVFRNIVAKKSVEIDYGGETQKLKSTNALMCCWDTCTGVKTGFTNDAGYCLSSSAEQDGLELYAVVLGCSDEIERFTDSYKLLEWGFAHYREYELASSEDILVDAPMSGYIDQTVGAGVVDDVSAYVLDYNGDVSVDVKLVDIPDGVEVGDEVGTIVWRQNETVVASAPLVAKEDVGAPAPWTSVFTSLVRLVGVLTGDEGIAESTLYAQTVVVEMGDENAGQIMDAATEKSIRAYVKSY